MKNTSHSPSSRGRKSGSNRSQRGGRSRRSGGRRSARGGSSSSWSRHGTALPDWTDLEPPANRRRSAPDDDSFLQRVSTIRFAAIVLLIAAAFTLYVGHVHATKDLLGEVQTARAENQRLHLKRNRLQGAFARKTSPSVIHRRARAMGLEESVTYGPTVTVE
jgi:hypothetical protein